MAVYLDVIWLLNWMFDSLLLYLSAIILKRQVKLWRVLAGGFIGSLIVILSFTPLHAMSNHPITKLLFSIIMILITFGFYRLRFFVKSLLTLYLATFLIGGALIGCHYFIQSDLNLSSAVFLASVKGFGDPISWMFVIMGFPIAWHFSNKKITQMEMTKIQYDQLAKVTILIDELSLEFTGLIDSGNQVYDPITKSPVLFASIEKMIDQCPNDLVEMAKVPQAIFQGECKLSEELEQRMRIIPCRVVGQEHQLIIAIKPDQIVIETKSTCYFVQKGLVSFTLQELSPENAFNCIVHPNMLVASQKTSKGSSSISTRGGGIPFDT